MNKFEHRLKNKNGEQRKAEKTKIASDFSCVGKHKKDRLEINIISQKALDGGGIEILAQVHQDNKQLGFGKDGSVDIERFIIWNFPILVEDSTGTIIHSWVDEKGIAKSRKLKEDPKEAILQSLAHTISLVGKDGANIVKGKVGNTTSTFYPDADPETTSMDGDVFQSGVNVTWATIHDGAGNGNDGATRNPQINARIETTATGYNVVVRSPTLFDTSAIPDTDNIDSATLSYSGESVTNTWTPATFSINIYATTPASNTAIASADYAQFGTTAFSTAIASGSWSTTGYNDFVLNASGLAGISKTGVSKFGTRESQHDAPNSEPTFEANRDLIIKAYSADAAGTTTDPKLVVVHSAAVPSPSVSDTATITENTVVNTGYIVKLDGGADTGGGMRQGLKIIG